MNLENVAGWSYFALFALVAVAGAALTIFNKSAIRCAMGLLVTIIAIAALYLPLHAQFLAAIQLIVYAGAVVVLFLFVIMLLGPEAETHAPARLGGPRAVAAGATLLTGGLFAYAALRNTADSLRAMPLELKDKTFGSIEGIGRELFEKSLVPFELSGALLLVAVLGAMAVAKTHDGAQS